MKQTRLILTLAAVCLLIGPLAGSTQAAEEGVVKRGIYGGVGFGAGFFEGPSNTEYAWRAHVWWRPHEYFAAEIGYIDAGDPSSTPSNEGLHLVAAPMVPVGPVDLIGKVGGFFPGLSDDDVAGGLGLGYRFYRGFGVRMDWDRLGWEDDDPIDVVTVSLYYHLSR